MSAVTFREIQDCYLKLKSYAYHENFSIDLKMRLAEFESTNIENQLKKLVAEANKTRMGRRSKLDRDIDSIKYFILPKKFDDHHPPNTNGYFFSNANQKPEYKIDNVRKLIPFIDCSIELHIISILWILRIGEKIDRKLDPSCFANRLAPKKSTTNSLNSAIKLFGRYFENYNRWRDSALNAAKAEHALGNDVAILNLDIQNYYNSVDFDLQQLHIPSRYKWLNNILSRIHIQYAQVLFKAGILPTLKGVIPIGMISSNILGNHYLSSFDRLIKKKVNPTFYGRYVDDVIIVFRNPKIDSKKDHFIPDFIEGKLCYTNTQQILGTKYKCAVARTSEKDFAISINSNELFFQLEKVKLYLLNKGDSIELIHSFEREIRKNTSEFKFQLETNDLIEGFEDSSYEITYDDTVNKLRSIEKMNTNKFGASKHLSKLINTVKQTSKVDTQKLEKVLTKIEELFSGQRALQLVSLWDKAFTLFVITRKQKGLIPFSRHLLHQIVRIRFNDEQLSIQQNEEIEANLKNGLLNQMILAFAMASALDISFFNTHIIKQLKTKATDRLGSVLKNLTQTHIKHLARQLIRSNLFRQSYLPFPLVNYCNQASTYSFNSPTLPKPTSFKLDETKVKYSPRFIHYHEVEMFYYLRSAFIGSTPLENSLKQRSDFVTRKFIELNRGNIRRFSTKAYPKAINESKGNPTWTINNAIRIKRLKVGLVNIQVHMAYMKEALNRKPILSFERLDSVNRVLNEAIRSRCHLIFFPEVSIPFQWLGRLMDFARRNNIGIICGIEHFINKNNEAFNYVATILPFALGRYRNAFIDLRLKIDYAPVEVAELKKYKRKVPKATKTERIRQYHWSGVSFSALNCFELTDINKRTNFKGAVDFLVTVEYNRDVAYFSSINESLARDLHCYVIQVNTAQFGDSRVTFPSESYSRDYIKIKGGRNISLITGELDITKLRQYQQISIDKKYMPRTLASQFKPLPPNFKLSPFRREVILPKKWSM